MTSTPRGVQSLLWLPALLLLGSCRPQPPCCPVPPHAHEPVSRQEDTATPSVRIATPRVHWQAADQAVRTSPCDVEPPPEAGVVALTGGLSYEHEVHDCQRLILRDGPVDRFGPLVAVYPLDQALVLKYRSDFGSWTRVASIYNWGNMDGAGDPQYVPLNIGAEWNCLWLQHSGTEWVAMIDRMGCLQPDPETGEVRLEPMGGSRLRVLESVHENRNPAYPETARWAWNESAGAQYIGLKCATAWCSITPADVRPNEPDILRGPEHRSIPGWYDEQRLAVNDGVAGTITPGPQGRIYPTRTHFQARRAPVLDWLFAIGFDAAEVEIEQRIPNEGDYTSKFNLRMAGATGRAKIWIRLGADAQAYFRNSLIGQGVKADLGVLDHEQHAAEGSVRWRWHDTDETAWVSCREGCCDVMPAH